MYSPGFELMTPGSRGHRSNHFAMEDSQFGKSIFPIYRQNLIKAVGTLCLSAYIVTTRGVPWKKKCRNCQNELARLSALRCPLISAIYTHLYQQLNS